GERHDVLGGDPVLLECLSTTADLGDGVQHDADHRSAVLLRFFDGPRRKLGANSAFLVEQLDLDALPCREPSPNLLIIGLRWPRASMEGGVGAQLAAWTVE